MLMSVQNSTSQTGEALVREHAEASGVYASLFEKINLTPVAALGDIDTWQDNPARPIDDSVARSSDASDGHAP